MWKTIVWGYNKILGLVVTCYNIVNYTMLPYFIITFFFKMSFNLFSSKMREYKKKKRKSTVLLDRPEKEALWIIHKEKETEKDDQAREKEKERKI